MSIGAVQYQVMKTQQEAILVVKISRLCEDNYSRVAESILEKAKTRLYRNITLLVGEDVDLELLEELKQTLESLGVRISIVRI